MKTLYLNNQGSRWVTFDDQGKKVKHTFLTKLGKEITRTVLWFEQFGNFALAAISYKGKVIKVFADELLED